MQSIDPMLLGEFISLADRKDRDSAAACRPDVRVLTGAEEVHLASGKARQANFRRGRADPGQDDREHVHTPIGLLLGQPLIAACPRRLGGVEGALAHWVITRATYPAFCTASSRIVASGGRSVRTRTSALFFS